MENNNKREENVDMICDKHKKPLIYNKFYDLFLCYECFKHDWRNEF